MTETKHKIIRIAQRISDLFFIWVILFSIWAFWQPTVFTPLVPYIKYGLGVIMFGMGMTLSKDDFLRVLKMPRAILCGILGQFIIMPLAAVLLVTIFNLPKELSLGFIILGACPGGTASNVIAYLSKADVALSVSMTACSTLLGVVLTPILIWALGNTYLSVDPIAMLKSVLQIVLLPISLGMFIHYILGKRIKNIQNIFPAISVVIIVLVIAAIVGLSQEKIAQMAMILLLTAVLHNVLGLSLGYALATAFKLPENARRTVAIEVGMQNSGLGVTLATVHFPEAPLVALPSAIFSVLHNITGSMLASFWTRDKIKESSPDN